MELHYVTLSYDMTLNDDVFYIFNVYVTFQHFKFLLYNSIIDEINFNAY